MNYSSKRRYVRGVKRGPTPATIPLPSGHYEGRTFIAEDGTEYEVLPLPVVDWPIGGARDTTEAARLHLRKPS